MIGKKFNSKWILRFSKGEELVSTLKEFCIQNKITLGSLTGIGATNQVKIGFFDFSTKQYCSKTFSEDFEITSLIGSISMKEGEIIPHIHITISSSNFHLYGGHLFEAFISATCEVILETIDGIIDRKLDPSTNLFLLDL